MTRNCRVGLRECADIEQQFVVGFRFRWEVGPGDAEFGGDELFGLVNNELAEALAIRNGNHARRRIGVKVRRDAAGRLSV